MRNVKFKKQFQKSNLERIIDKTLTKAGSSNNSAQKSIHSSTQLKKYIVQKVVNKERQSTIRNYNKLYKNETSSSFKNKQESNQSDTLHVFNHQQKSQKLNFKKAQSMNYLIKMDSLAKDQLLTPDQIKNTIHQSLEVKNKNIILLKPKLTLKKSEGRLKQFSFVGNQSTNQVQIKPQNSIQIIQNSESQAQKTLIEKNKGNQIIKQKNVINVFKIFQESQKNLPLFNQTNKSKFPLKFRVKPKIKSQTNHFIKDIYKTNSNFFQSSILQPSKEEMRNFRLNTNSNKREKEKEKAQIKINQEKMKNQLKTFYNCIKDKKHSTQLRMDKNQDQMFKDFKDLRKNIQSVKQTVRTKDKYQQIITSYKQIKQQMLSGNMKQQKAKIIRQPYSLTNILAYQALQPYLQSMTMHVNYINKQDLSFKSKKILQKQTNEQTKRKPYFVEQNKKSIQTKKICYNKNSMMQKRLKQKSNQQQKKQTKQTKQAQKISAWQINDLIYSQENQICD